MPSLRKIVLKAVMLLVVNQLMISVAKAQGPRNIHFYHLTTAQGLSDNYVRNMCLDRTGNLWIGTQDGLNMFNGKTVSWFLKEKHPQLESDYIRKLYCDEKDRVWVLGQGGFPAVIDENRRFHKISLYHGGKLTTSRWLLENKEHGGILFTKEGFYALKEGQSILNEDSLTNKHFTKLKIYGIDTLQARTFSQVELFDDSRHIFSIEDGFFVIDFTMQSVSQKYLFPNRFILGKWLPGELLVYEKNELELHSINLETQQVSWPLRGIKDQHGKALTARIINAKMIDDESLLISTYLEGLYLYNCKTKVLTNYRHIAADPTTFINDHPKAIEVSKDGWVFIAAAPNGLSYFKRNAVVSSKQVFIDKLGNSYNGYVSCIATLDNNIFYVGVGNNLVKWNRHTNQTNFLDYAEVDGKKLMHNENVGHIEIDPMKRLWVGTLEHGVFVLDKNDKAIRSFRYEKNKPGGIPAKRIYDVKRAPDGYMWLPTDSGICRAHPQTYQIDHLEKTAIARLKKTACNLLYFSDNNNLWIGTVNKGLYHYTFSDDSLRNYNLKDGFISNYILAIKSDNHKNIYVGTDKGLQILLNNGKTRLITQKDGLMHLRAENLLLDKRNRMWIGNDVGIACFNIADSSLKYFDETYGLSIQGFRVTSHLQTTEDEQVWGTENGIQYFFPDELYNYKNDLKVAINRIESRNHFTNLAQSKSYRLAANDNYVTFYFGTIEYLPKLRTFYEYKLEGLDEDWIKVVNQNSVRYSGLPPGKYSFKVRASNDNKVWVNAENEISISVATPFYGSFVFKILALLTAAALLWYVLRYYRKKQLKQQEELETEVVINYFASQINSRYRSDELLWDVARNLIGKLQFEDCMIYLWNEDKTMLVQKAGYGSKGSMQELMDKTVYHIPGGKGIVGAVVEGKQSIMVNDTSKDKRYFTADGKIMLSELCVPLIYDNEVLGAINTENRRRNFFTAKHQKMLSTIAVLCSNQLQRIKAEEEKQQAIIEALQDKQKMTESKLQSLRLQMNPHFLFNALNSIQQMILANEEMIATRYLSRFSKLLRTILIHSDKEMVTLKEELEILNLYVELEAIRFKDSFHYSIEFDEDIDIDEVKVPTLLIQPFVENAIWHGLMHKEGQRNLSIRFFEKADHLYCIVEDNGIGREKAREARISSDQGKKHTSKGIAVSMERLRTLGKGNGHAGSLDIIDLKDQNGLPTGTRIEIYFPIQN